MNTTSNSINLLYSEYFNKNNNFELNLQNNPKINTKKNNVKIVKKFTKQTTETKNTILINRVKFNAILDTYNTTSWLSFLCCYNFLKCIRIRSPEMRALFQLQKDSNKNQEKEIKKADIINAIANGRNNYRMTLFSKNPKTHLELNKGGNEKYIKSTDRVIAHLHNACIMQ